MLGPVICWRRWLSLQAPLHKSVLNDIPAPYGYRGRLPASRAGAANGVTSPNLIRSSKRPGYYIAWPLPARAHFRPHECRWLAGPVMRRESNKTTFLFCCVRHGWNQGAFPPPANCPALAIAQAGSGNKNAVLLRSRAVRADFAPRGPLLSVFFQALPILQDDARNVNPVMLLFLCVLSASYIRLVKQSLKQAQICLLLGGKLALFKPLEIKVLCIPKSIFHAFFFPLRRYLASIRLSAAA